MTRKKIMCPQLWTMAIGFACSMASPACYDGPPTDASWANVSPPKRENVKVVPREELARIQSLDLDGVLVVAATPWWEDVAVGDVLVMEVSERTPEGSLRRVTSVQSTSGELTLATTQSVLTEVFEDGQLSLRVPISASPIQEVLFAEEGVAVGPSGPVVPVRIFPGFRADDSNEGFNLNLTNVVLYDHDKNKSTKNDQILLNGALHADLDMDLSVEIGFAKIKRFSAGIKATYDRELELKTSPLIKISESKPIFKAKLQPIVIHVIVPIVIVPTVELVAKFEASVDAFAISTTRKDSVQYDAALVRENKMWTPQFKRTDTHDAPPPEIGGVGATEVKVSIGPRITTKVYSLAGPSLETMRSLRLTIAQSMWKLYAGLSTSMGIEFSIGDWDWTKLQFDYTFVDEEEEIAHGNVFPTPCGDGIINGPEDCDGVMLGGETCTSQGAGSGTLKCTPSCTFDLSGCTGPTCGDNSLDAGEACDGAWIEKTCEDLGYDGGVLACTPACQLNESACCKNTCTPALSECVNSAMRHCLPGDNGCYSWDKWIPCPNGCDGAVCYNAQCSNGVVDEANGEQCDGGDLNGKNCVTLGFNGGVLGCSNCMFDMNDCCYDGFSILNAEYPSTTSSASGCAVDAGITLKLSVQDNGGFMRFYVTKADGTKWSSAAVLRLYVGSGPTCGTPMNIAKATANVVVGATTQIIDLDVINYENGWSEGTTKEFWVGKSEDVHPAGRASGSILIQRDLCQ